MATQSIQPIPYKNLWCSSENYGAGGQSRRLVDITREYSDQTIIWQGMVYAEARKIAERNNSQRVVDIGAGAGKKLITYFNDIDLELLQVDFTDNREKQNDVQTPEFFRANFEDVLDLERFSKRLSDNIPTTFIFSDVIEHLDDPRFILRVLRSLLKNNPDNRLILSTPDRDRIDGKGSSSLPDNPTHVRQWTAPELKQALSSGCFVVENIKHIPENQFDHLDRTILVELSCSEESHRIALAEMHLPSPSDHLVITTEHSKAQYTGGIGTYYQVSEDVTGLARTVLFVGGHGIPFDWAEFCTNNNWMHMSSMCGKFNATHHEVCNYRHDDILEATLAVIFLYDQIKLIEYQDFSGIGAVIAQAKRAHLIPESVCLLAYAHGSHLYLDNAAEAINRYRSLEIDVRERLAMELADVVAFPSIFLRDLYIETGKLEIKNYQIQPYPIQISDSPVIDTQYSKIDTLIFYGKHSKQKGYFDFCDAVVSLLNDSTKLCSHQIKKIVVLGSTSPDPRLFDLTGVEVSYGVFSHREVIEILEDLSKNSLVILPYKGDNHPLSLFEVISSGSQLLAYRAGGIPEQIPQELHEKILCDPNIADLVEGIEQAINFSFWDRCSLIRDTKVLTSEKYKIHSNEYKKFIDSLKVSIDRPQIKNNGDITIIMPNYNGVKTYLEDAFSGIVNSFRRPDKVIVIDDSSSQKNYGILKEFIDHSENLPIEVIRNSQNLGLAQTRNIGLDQCVTEYICAHDNDNILLNRFLQLACNAMDLDPTIDAVTCWTRAFNDGDNWQSRETTTIDYSFRPVGSDIGMGLTNNVFGDAMAVYRTSTLREFGGWDGSSKAMWEDWQLFLKFAANGKKILVIPKELILYRVRKNSMLRTYPEFDAWMRIANAIPSVPDNNRFGMIRAVSQPDWKHYKAENERLFHETKLLYSEVQRLTVIEQSWSWRIMKRFISILSRFPRLRATLKYIGRHVAKIIRR